MLQADDGRAHALGGVRPPRVDLGRSQLFFPAPPDSVWLVTGDGRGPRGGMRVRQVDLLGDGVARPTPVPAGRVPGGGAGRSWLLEDGAGLRWWTPTTGETHVVPGRCALAAGERPVVVCLEDCRTVDVLDRDGGRVARLRMAETVTAAVVAPDERAIALLTRTELATAALVIVDRDAETMQSITNGVAAAARPRADLEPGRSVVVLSDSYRAHRRDGVCHRSRQHRRCRGRSVDALAAGAVE